MSHKVIGNLLEAVTKAADELGIRVSCAQKVKTGGEAPPSVEEITSNDAAVDRLANGRANVVGGTAWLWADPKALNAVDVLFVDEAGQMSLANVLAASQGGLSVVLLGDPQQLDQPQQGSHPEGADVSALEHMLGDHKTIPPDRGIFLSETWRLAPSICRFTSEVFYEGGCLHTRVSNDKCWSERLPLRGRDFGLTPLASGKSELVNRRGRRGRPHCRLSPQPRCAMDRQQRNRATDDGE